MSRVEKAILPRMNVIRLKRFLPLVELVLAIALLAAAGCTQVQVGPQVQGEYRFGELQVFADRSFATVHAAAIRGMKDAGLFQTRDDRKVFEAELNGRVSDDTLVIVKIKEVGANRTSVKIRYGVFSSDLAGAQQLYQAIAKYL
jgi:hypothetical protein